MYMGIKNKSPNYVSTTNACKLCRPMGACLAFKGIEGAVPFLHGSQGCATYMRRYIISHFNEPIDIASSSLGEKHAVYGGEANLRHGLNNVSDKYGASLIGIATTCLTETIGDDVNMILNHYLQDRPCAGPVLVNVSTPSYSGTHMEGFHAAVKAVVMHLAEGGEKRNTVNILPGFVSPADIRHIKEIVEDFGLSSTVLPDISETLDGPIVGEYKKIQRGGTPIAAIRAMGASLATIEFGRILSGSQSAGDYLFSEFDVTNHRIGLPVGIRETDTFLNTLSEISGRSIPSRILDERERLVDAMVDAHKYVFGKRAIVYGEEDLVVGLTSFLTEIGVMPVLCASGGKSGRFKEEIKAVTETMIGESPVVEEDMDFYQISQMAESLEPDFLIGHSKGYPIARKLGIPLIRVGFPIHDRIGGQRILHIGYRGALQLFDRIANSMIEKKQESSPVGYSYY